MLPFFSGMILSDLDNIGTKEDGIEQLKDMCACVYMCETETERQRQERGAAFIALG